MEALRLRVTAPLQSPQRTGARPGHPGAGRQAFDVREAEPIVDVPAEVGDRCPHGAILLEDRGTGGRAVRESRPVTAARVRWRARCRCGAEVYACGAIGGCGTFGKSRGLLPASDGIMGTVRIRTRAMDRFRLTSAYQPQGDQPKAIKE